MRKIVVLLVIANVAFLLWGLQSTDAQEDAGSDLNAEAELTEFNNLETYVPGEANTEAAQAEVTVAERCRFVGPLETRELPAEVLAAINGQSGQSWVETQRAEAPLWWVHLAPASTTAEARQRLAALQQRGIDSFRIDDGEFRNAISLGYFRSRDNANRLTEEYQRRDIDAQVRELPQARSIYWYRLPADGESTALAEVVEAADLAIQEHACDWRGSAS